MITFKQMRNFIVLGETLHFAQAARKLGIASAVLSKEIFKMENTLGFKLLDRSDKRNIVLTEAGEVYWKSIRDLPGILENARAAGRKIANGEQGTLTVAISGISCCFFKLEDVCQKFSACYPQVKFHLKEVFSPRMTGQLLENGQCDAAVFPVVNDALPGWQEKFEVRTLGNYFFNYMLPAGHELIDRELIHFRDVLKYPLILPSRDFAPGLRKFLDNCFMTETGMIPHPNYEVDGLEIYRRLIAAGLGIGVIAGNSHLADAWTDKIVLKPLDSSLSLRNIIAWRTQRNSKLISNFYSVMQEGKH